MEILVLILICNLKPSIIIEGFTVDGHDRLEEQFTEPRQAILWMIKRDLVTELKFTITIK